MQISAPVYELKRQAKMLARAERIPLHAALDRIALQQGFARWSLLAAKHAEASPADKMTAQLAPGDVVLIGGRPGQGKTLFGLDLAAAAVKSGNRALVFSLELTTPEVLAALRELGVLPEQCGDRLEIDCSDAICAEHIIVGSAHARRGDVIIVDYLQILDQRRGTPELDAQVRALRAFARECGSVIAFISQIDRAYDPIKKPYPDVADVRLPNALDLGLFDKAFFLANGEVRFSKAA